MRVQSFEAYKQGIASAMLMPNTFAIIFFYVYYLALNDPIIPAGDLFSFRAVLAGVVLGLAVIMWPALRFGNGAMAAKRDGYFNVGRGGRYIDLAFLCALSASAILFFELLYIEVIAAHLVFYAIVVNLIISWIFPSKRVNSNS